MTLFCSGKEIKVTKPDTPTTRLAYFREQWYRKWNRVGAVIMGVLGFSLMIAIVMDSVWRAGQLDPTNDTTSIHKENLNDVVPLCRVKNATISCSRLWQRYNLDEIYKKCQPHPLNDSVALEITSITNPILCLRNKWIMSTSFSVQQLTLRNLFIFSIATNAFSGPLFESTREISLISSHIFQIENGAFHTLTLYSLKLENISIVTIERHFSIGFYKTVERLEFKNLKILAAHRQELFQNLTGRGKPVFVRAKHVDLSQNALDKLDESLFDAITNVESLNLEYSNIVQIKIGTFSKLHMLKVLKLTGNKLMNFLEVIFANCKFLIRENCRIILTDNNWKQQTPFNPEGIFAKDLARFHSKSCSFTPNPLLNCFKISTTSKHSIFVSFTLSQISFNAVQIKIGPSQEELLLKLTIMSNSRQQNDKIDTKTATLDSFSCVDSFKNATIVSNLIPNTSYTVCVMKVDESLVSPFSCQSITLTALTEPDDHTSWINRHISLILSITALVMSFTIGLIIGNLSKWMHSMSMPSQKKVVLINHKPSISNSEENEDIYGHIYCTINTPKLSRSLSDSAGLYYASQEDNYVQPREFSGSGKISERLSSSMIVYPSEPPPLPPYPVRDKL